MLHVNTPWRCMLSAHEAVLARHMTVRHRSPPDLGVRLVRRGVRSSVKGPDDPTPKGTRAPPPPALPLREYTGNLGAKPCAAASCPRRGRPEGVLENRRMHR